jgi:hypothetical protein
MSKPTIVLLAFGLTLFLPHSVDAQPRTLSDKELDTISVGTGDICAWFGITGPCLASILQMTNPQNPQQNQEIAVALPANGSPVTITLQASSTSPDGFRTQTATQSNSGSNNPQSFLNKGLDLSPLAVYSRTSPVIRQ